MVYKEVKNIDIMTYLRLKGFKPIGFKENGKFTSMLFEETKEFQEVFTEYQNSDFKVYNTLHRETLNMVKNKELL